jgi:hypothetical protein
MIKSVRCGISGCYYGSGSYNLYFERLKTDKMKIRGVLAHKGDTPEHARRMQQDLFNVLPKVRCLYELNMIEPVTREVREKYLRELGVQLILHTMMR